MPIPHEDAPARQHLDFAALVTFSNLAKTNGYSTSPGLYDAANAAGGAYFELYPSEIARSEAAM